jgi:LysM repeat protein
MVLSVHVVVIGGMLLQGCKDTATTQAKQDGSTNAPGETTPAMANTTPMTNTAPGEMPSAISPNNISNTLAGTGALPAPAMPAPTPNTTVVPMAKSTDLSPAPATGEAKEYVIAKGDTLGAIARKNGVSLKALTEANPNVNAKKLQIGQKVQIPAGTAALATTNAPGATPALAGATPADGDVYVVKTGDTLTKIAKTHGTTFKKIMAMNDLKTTSIRAGQKLKLPAAKPSASEPAATPVSTPAAASASLTPTPPAGAPMKVSAATPVSSPVAAN